MAESSMGRRGARRGNPSRDGHLRAPPVPVGWAVVAALGLLLTSSIAVTGVPSYGPFKDRNAGPPTVVGSTMVRSAVEARSGGPATAAPASHALGSLPAAGFSLTVLGGTPTGISLSWSVTNDFFFSSYSVLLSAQGPAGPWTTVGVVTPQSASQFAMFGLEPGETYWWQVTENGSFGSRTTNVFAYAQPTLAYLTWTQPTSSSARFNWTNNASYGGLLSFASYNLYESASGGRPAAVATSSNVSHTTATITGLTSGASYAFFLNTTDCISGCASIRPEQTKSNTVTIGTILPLVASISAGRPVVDSGELDTFQCAPSGGQSPFRFSWDFGNGTYVPGGSSVSHAFAAAGPVTVTCLVNDSVSTVSTAATTITVVAALTSSISANRSAADVGQSVQFSCTTSHGATPVTVEWTLGDGTNASGRTAVHAYASSGTMVATCTSTDSAGYQVANSTTVVVSPAVAVNASANSPKAAPSVALTFRATASGGTGSYSSYRWAFGDGATASNATARHAFTVPGNFTVSVQLSDSNGGSAAQSFVVDISRVEVQLLTSSSSADIGGSVTFSASASGGAGGPYTYRWDFGDGGHATGATVHHTYTGLGTDHPTLSVSDALGGATNVSLAAISIGSPSAWFIEFGVPALLVVAGILGLMVGVYQYLRARARAVRNPGPLAGWVPMAGPDTHARGIRLCPACGAANLPIRSSCATCGRRLPKLLP